VRRYHAPELGRAASRTLRRIAVFQDFPLGTSDISLPLDSSASVDQRISIKEKRVNLSTVTTLETTIETADAFGLIMGSLRKSGKPIPINDVWIAAHGLETGSILVTYDDHFAVIPGLRLWPEIGH